MMRWYRTSEKCISLIAHSDEEYRQRVTTQNTKKDNKKEKREAKVGNVGVGTCKQKIQLTISISIRQWERSRKRGLPQRKEKKKSVRSVDGPFAFLAWERAGCDDRILMKRISTTREKKKRNWVNDEKTRETGREDSRRTVPMGS